MNQIIQRGGIVIGPPHSGGGVPFVLQDTGTHIEEEGMEINIPRELAESNSIHTFTGTNAEVLNKILSMAGLSIADKVTHVRSGDIVICVRSAWDDTSRKFSGTIEQILHQINTSKGCKPIIQPIGNRQSAVGNQQPMKAKEGGTIKKSNIEGIYYLITQIGSGPRFLRIIHKPSETAIINFTSSPVQRTSDIIKASEEILSKVNWNIPESELTEEHGKAVLELRRKVQLDSSINKYVVKMQIGGIIPAQKTGGTLPVNIKHRIKDWQAENPNSPRWKKKKARIEELSNNIHRLRMNVSRDLQNDDQRIALTALVIAVMDRTAERIGNDHSADNGHFGVTGFKKNHIDVIGNKVHLDYTGKSGTKHEKSFSDERIAKALKKAVKNSKGKFIFETNDGFRIKSDKVNRYLEQFKISAKDLRGYNANKWIIEKLHKDSSLRAERSNLPEDKQKKERKTIFNKAVKEVAMRVGHGKATLRKHYMIPELPIQYIEHGKIIDMKNLGYFAEGGQILLSPNGSKSNLNEIQWKLVRTPEFIEWFGDWINSPETASKVVDENGEPQIMYHGTLDEFFIFDRYKTQAIWRQGLFFVAINKKTAEHFADNNRYQNDERKVIILPLFVNAKNIFDIEKNQQHKEIAEKYWLKRYMDRQKVFTIERMKDNWSLLEDKDFIAKNILNKYDAIYVTEKRVKSKRNLGVFSSNQLKFSDGTNTTFNSKNPDIRMTEGSRIENNNSKINNMKKLSRQQVEKAIAEAHDKITRIKGKDYAPTTKEIQAEIDKKEHGEKIWQSMSEPERIKFIEEKTGKQHTYASIQDISKKKYQFVPADIKNALDPGDLADGGEIDSNISAKYNILRYGNKGMNIHNESGKVLKIFNDKETDTKNWHDAVEWAKKNSSKIKMAAGGTAAEKYHFPKGELAPAYDEVLEQLRRIGSDLWKHKFKDEKKFRVAWEKLGDIYFDNVRELNEKFAGGGFIREGDFYVTSYKFNPSSHKWNRGYIKPIWSEKTTIPVIVNYDLYDDNKRDIIKSMTPAEAERLLFEHKIVKGSNITQSSFEEGGSAGKEPCVSFDIYIKQGNPELYERLHEENINSNPELKAEVDEVYEAWSGGKLNQSTN